MKILFKSLFIFSSLIIFFSGFTNLEAASTLNLAEAEVIAKNKVEKGNLIGYKFLSIKPLEGKKDYFQALVSDNNKNDMSIIIMPSGFPIGPIPTSDVGVFFKDSSNSKESGALTITTASLAHDAAIKYLSSFSGFKIVSENEIKQPNGVILYKFEVTDSLGNLFNLEYSGYGIKKHLTYKEKI